MDFQKITMLDNLPEPTDNNHHHHIPKEIYNHPKDPALKKKKKYNCGKISTHVDQCQFCKKLYSSDKNLYILFIIFLFFICFLLFKKILSV